ncbi:MAG: NAD(P)-binding protein [Gammaproteobacteria bacterium]|nr:NAD(P)-binding protein [Gammaproteobacteria bacterium]
MIEQRDIIIIGGGVSGLLLAALLQHSGLTLAVIERQEQPPGAVVGEDLRQRAINPGSQQLLEQLHLWSSLTVSPYHKMVVWEEGSEQRLNFSADAIGQPVLGHIVSEQQIHQALYQHLHASAMLKFFYRATPKQWHYDGTINHLELTTGEQFKAPLIIAADGANSWLRQQTAIEFVGHDYYQRALVANVTTERPHRQTAWQIFLPHGPVGIFTFN